MNTALAPASPSFDVLALVASAGGLDALTRVLAGLPRDFPMAVVVGQHLGTNSVLAEILGRRIGLPVGWAEDHTPLQAGAVTICPPHMRMEVRADGRCLLTACRLELLPEKPFDGLLTSLAESFGPRALAVVLTGMGSDGAAGARTLRAAGGVVLVQDAASAEFPDMPRNAIAAGAADAVLPLAGIAPAIQGLAAGGPRPGSIHGGDWPEPAGSAMLLPVGVYSCDTAGNFQYYNRRAVDLWGAEPARDDHWWAFCGAARALLPDGTALQADDSPMAEVLRGGAAVRNRALTILRADGARIDLALDIRPLTEEGRLVGAVCAFLDVTARRQAERSLHSLRSDFEDRVAQRTEALRASEAGMAAQLRGSRVLNELWASLVGERDPDVLYRQILKAAMALARADGGTVQLLDPETQELVIVADSGFPAAMVEHFRRVPAGSSTSCGQALRANRRAFADYAAPAAALDPSLRMHADLGLRLGQSTPLVARTGLIIGMVSTHTRRGDVPLQYVQDQLDLLARLAADLLESRRPVPA